MYKNYVKRILDFILALIAMPFVLFIILLMAPIIYLNDRGPIFYNALRLGENGKNFKMFKFRSMKVHAPDIRLEDGSAYNSTDDPRVTRVGKIMRKLSIDEAPQIINVLLGQMSFVGPRPNLATTQFDSFDYMSKKRVEVKPGITGYSQAYFRNSIKQEQKTINDCYYVDHISFLFDMKILFKTVKTVFIHENIYIQPTDAVFCEKELSKEETVVL